MASEHCDVSVSVGEISDSDHRIGAARHEVIFGEEFCAKDAASMANQLLHRLYLSY